MAGQYLSPWVGSQDPHFSHGLRQPMQVESPVGVRARDLEVVILLSEHRPHDSAGNWMA